MFRALLNVAQAIVDSLRNVFCFLLDALFQTRQTLTSLFAHKRPCSPAVSSACVGTVTTAAGR